VSLPSPPADPVVPPPQRLNPLTILIKALSSLPSTLFALPLLFAWTREDSLPLGLLVGLTLLLAAAAMTFSWLSWRAFTYQILPDQLVIQRGILFRTRRSIPVSRIQDVSIRQRPLARLFGLAEVRIETGGGEADEGQLNSVSLAEAYRLREVIRSLRAGEIADMNREAEARTLPAPEPEPELQLFKMELPRLLYSGLFRFSLVWIAAIFVGLQYLDQAMGSDYDRWIEMIDVAEQEVKSRFNLLALAGVAAAVIGLGLLAGVVRTVLQNFDFTLTHNDARFRYRRGLLTRNEVVVARRQIQLGLVERGAVAGRLGWNTLKVQTLGGSDQVTGRQELVPFATAEELAPIIARTGLPRFEQSGLTYVSRLHIVGGLLGLVILGSIILLVSLIAYPPAGLLLLAMPFLLAVALFRSRFHRYGLTPASLQVSRGVLSQRDWTVPYGNIQAITVLRGPLQRLLGLATLRIDTAGGRGMHGPHIHDIEEAKVVGFVQELTDRVEALRGPKRPDPGPGRLH